MTRELRILSSMMYGFDFSDEAWEQALATNPDYIVGQGTTADGGPNYLGTDEPFAGLSNMKSDVSHILKAAAEKGFRFVISTGTPSGSNIALNRAMDIIEEVAQELRVNLDVAVIPGEIDPAYLKAKIAAGTQITRIEPHESLRPVLVEQDITDATRIVGQMGPEPMMAALKTGVQGVICGRSLDIGLYMAPAMLEGYDKGLSAHLGKIVECGGMITSPQSMEPVFAALRDDHFLVSPTLPHLEVPVDTLVAHTFYEREDPLREPNPGGILDLTQAWYKQEDPRTVRIGGSRWIDQPYTVKIEGVKLNGYRTMGIAGIRDPALLACIDDYIDRVRARVAARFSPLVMGDDYQLIFRMYGRDGVLGEREPERDAPCHEIGLIVDATAANQNLAGRVCAATMDYVAHMDFPNRISTGANAPFPYSPREFSTGTSYRYHIWHALPLEDPCEPFKINYRTLGRRG